MNFVYSDRTLFKKCDRLDFYLGKFTQEHQDTNQENIPGVN
ncbi:MAG: hypothetical protein WBM44_19300 [Waterburya sp.]